MLEYENLLNSDLINNSYSLLNEPDMEDLNYKCLKENLKLLKFDSSMRKIQFALKRKS